MLALGVLVVCLSAVFASVNATPTDGNAETETAPGTETVLDAGSGENDATDAEMSANQDENSTQEETITVQSISGGFIIKNLDVDGSWSGTNRVDVCYPSALTLSNVSAPANWAFIVKNAEAVQDNDLTDQIPNGTCNKATGMKASSLKPMSMATVQSVKTMLNALTWTSIMADVPTESYIAVRLVNGLWDMSGGAGLASQFYVGDIPQPLVIKYCSNQDQNASPADCTSIGSLSAPTSPAIGWIGETLDGKTRYGEENENKHALVTVQIPTQRHGTADSDNRAPAANRANVIDYVLPKSSDTYPKIGGAAGSSAVLIQEHAGGAQVLTSYSSSLNPTFDNIDAETMANVAITKYKSTLVLYFAPEKDTVTYNLNSASSAGKQEGDEWYHIGSYLPATEQNNHATTVNEGKTPANPRLIGHAFLGWAASADNCAHKTYWQFATDVTHGTTELFACWDTQNKIVYDVIYNLNGGVSDAQPQPILITKRMLNEKLTQTGGNNVALPTNLHKAGYIASNLTNPAGAAWKIGANAVSDDTRVVANSEVIAQWTKHDDVAISYVKGIAVGDNAYEFPENVTDLPYDSVQTVPAEPKAVGYEFKGWKTDNSFDTPFDFTKRITQENTQIFAEFEAKTESFTLDANYPTGKNGQGAAVFEQGAIGTYTIKLNDFAKNAYVDGTEAKLDLTAKPKGTGYRFVKWTAEKTPLSCAVATEYDFEQRISAETTVYACWEDVANPTITFAQTKPTNPAPADWTDSGTVTMNDVLYNGIITEAKAPIDTQASGATAAPKAGGYVFQGWTRENGAEFDFETDRVTDIITFTPKFTIKSDISITYHANSVCKQSATFKSSDKLYNDIITTVPTDSLPAWMTCAGYSFDGYFLGTSDNAPASTDGATQIFPGTSRYLPTDMHVWLMWTPLSHSIAINNKGAETELCASLQNVNQTKLTAESVNFAVLQAPQCSGFKFKGWKRDGDNDTIYSTTTDGGALTEYTVPNADTETYTFVAQWETIDYAINPIIDPSESAEETNTSTIVLCNEGRVPNPDNPCILASDEITDAHIGDTIRIKATPAVGYKLTNWATTQGVMFDEPTDAETTMLMVAQNVTLTARFEKISYTLTIQDPDNKADLLGWTDPKHNLNATTRAYKLGDTIRIEMDVTKGLEAACPDIQDVTDGWIKATTTNPETSKKTVSCTLQVTQEIITKATVAGENGNPGGITFKPTVTEKNYTAKITLARAENDMSSGFTFSVKPGSIDDNAETVNGTFIYTGANETSAGLTCASQPTTYPHGICVDDNSDGESVVINGLQYNDKLILRFAPDANAGAKPRELIISVPGMQASELPTANCVESGYTGSKCATVSYIPDNIDVLMNFDSLANAVTYIQPTLTTGGIQPGTVTGLGGFKTGSNLYVTTTPVKGFEATGLTITALNDADFSTCSFDSNDITKGVADSESGAIVWTITTTNKVCGPTYQDNTDIIEMQGGIEINANWTASENIITVDPNEGILYGETVTKNGTITSTTGELVPMPKTPTRTGYDFTGWTYSVDGRTDYKACDTDNPSNCTVPNKNAFVTPASDDYPSATLTAGWQKKKYSVVFVTAPTGQEQITGTPSRIDDVLFDTPALQVNQSIAPPIRSGFTFCAWTENTAVSSIEFTDCDNLMYDVDKTVTKFDLNATHLMGNVSLYPVWKINTPTLTYDVNGGVKGANAAESQVVTYKSTVTYAPETQNPSRQGYVFQGWTLTRNGDDYFYFMNNDAGYTGGANTTTSAPTPMFSTDRTIYAKWSKAKYALTYAAYEGIYSTNPVSLDVSGTLPPASMHEFGDTVNAPSRPERTGYDFTGWNIWAENSSAWCFTGSVLGDIAETACGDPSTIPANNVILNAVWKAKTYSVTFNYNYAGATEPAYKYNAQSFDSVISSPGIPERTGYDFAGWFTNATGGNEYVMNESAMKEAKDLALYAHWSAAPQAIQFTCPLPAGASKSVVNCPANTTSLTNATYVLPASKPTLEGFTFTGYKVTEIGGSAVAEGVGAIKQASEQYGITPAGGLKFEAQFAIKKLNVKFDEQFGNSQDIAPVVPKTRENINYGAKITAPETNPIRPAYEFAGWFTEPTNGSEWDFAQDTMPDVESGNVFTLYAHWTEMPTKIKVTLNKSTTSQQELQIVEWLTGTNDTTPVVDESTDYNGFLKGINTSNLAAQGMQFLYWVESVETCEEQTPVDLATRRFTQDIELYACWNGISQTEVIFDKNSDNAVISWDIDGIIAIPADGASISRYYRDITWATKPKINAIPTAIGQVFTKWVAVQKGFPLYTGENAPNPTKDAINNACADENSGYAWDLSDLTGGIRETTYLAACWQNVPNRDITFDANLPTNPASDGAVKNIPEPRTEIYNDSQNNAAPPKNQELEGYTFQGWYTTTGVTCIDENEPAGCGEQNTLFDFAYGGETAPSGKLSQVAYAKWTINRYNVIIKLQNGAADITGTRPYKATLPALYTTMTESGARQFTADTSVFNANTIDPWWSGKKFAGWYLNPTFNTPYQNVCDSSNDNCVQTASMPAHDVTIYASSINGAPVNLTFDVISGLPEAQVDTDKTVKVHLKAPNAFLASDQKSDSNKTATVVTYTSLSDAVKGVNPVSQNKPAHDLFNASAGFELTSNATFSHWAMVDSSATDVATACWDGENVNTTYQLTLTTTIGDDTTADIAQSKHIYACYAPKDSATLATASITLNPNYGTESTSDITVLTDSTIGSNQISPALTQREGYIFDGWFTLADGGEKVTISNISTPANGQKGDEATRFSADQTIYAHWTIRQFTAKVDYQNGTVISNTYDYGTLFNTIIASETPLRAGYKFIGYCRQSAAPATISETVDTSSGNLCNGGNDPLLDLSATDNAPAVGVTNNTIYALWQYIAYTAQFTEANRDGLSKYTNGTYSTYETKVGSNVVQSYRIGQNVTLIAAEPETGYRFVRFDAVTGDDLVTPQINNPTSRTGANFTALAGNVKIRATYYSIKYKLEFQVDCKDSLKANAQCTGAHGASVTYAHQSDGDYVGIGEVVKGETVTLNPQILSNAYTISLAGDKFETSTDTPWTVREGENEVLLTALGSVAYASGGIGNGDQFIAPTGNVLVTYHVQPKTYALTMQAQNAGVTANVGDGNATEMNFNVESGSLFTNITATPAQGYHFTGWSLAEEKDGVTILAPSSASTSISAKAANSIKDATIIASAVKDKYNIQFVRGDGPQNLIAGSGLPQTIQDVEFGKDFASIEYSGDPKAVGYEFKGWLTPTEQNDAKAFVDLGAMPALTDGANYVLTGKWETANTVKIVFNANVNDDAGTGDGECQSEAGYDAKIDDGKLNKCKTDANGDYSSAKVSDDFATTFTDIDGIGINTRLGSVEGLPTATPQATGYTFKNWSSNAECTDSVTLAGNQMRLEEKSTDADYTYYACWTRQPITKVQFLRNTTNMFTTAGVTNEEQSIAQNGSLSLLYGETAISTQMPATQTFEGYTTDGRWYLNAGTNTASGTPSGTSQETFPFNLPNNRTLAQNGNSPDLINISVYLHWTRNSYPVYVCKNTDENNKTCDNPDDYIILQLPFHSSRDELREAINGAGFTKTGWVRDVSTLCLAISDGDQNTCATGKDYGNDVFTGITDTGANKLKVWIVWTNNTANIIYRGNEPKDTTPMAEHVPDGEKAEYDTGAHTLNTGVPTLTGYKFVAWCATTNYNLQSNRFPQPLTVSSDPTTVCNATAVDATARVVQGGTSSGNISIAKLNWYAYAIWQAGTVKIALTAADGNVTVSSDTILGAQNTYYVNNSYNIQELVNALTEGTVTYAPGYEFATFKDPGGANIGNITNKLLPTSNNVNSTDKVVPDTLENTYIYNLQVTSKKTTHNIVVGKECGVNYVGGNCGTPQIKRNSVDAATAQIGDNIEVIPAPASGYKTKKVEANGVEVSLSNGKYNFVMPAQNMQVVVTYEPIQYTVTAIDKTGGNVKAGGTGSAQNTSEITGGTGENKFIVGETVSIIATADRDYSYHANSLAFSTPSASYAVFSNTQVAGKVMTSSFKGAVTDATDNPAIVTLGVTWDATPYTLTPKVQPEGAGRLKLGDASTGESTQYTVETPAFAVTPTPSTSALIWQDGLAIGHKGENHVMYKLAETVWTGKAAVCITGSLGNYQFTPSAVTEGVCNGDQTLIVNFVEYPTVEVKFDKGAHPAADAENPKTQVIYLNADGSAGVYKAQSPAYNFGAETGYKFVGTNAWFKGTGGTDTPCESMESSAFDFNNSLVAENMVLCKKYEASSYAFKLVDYDGSGNSLESNVAFGATITILAAPTSPGLKFLGWYEDKEKSTTPYTGPTGDTIMPAKDLILYAKWQELPISITMDYQNGTGYTATGEGAFYKSVPSNLLTSPNRTGGTFVGWFTEPNGQGKQFTDQTALLPTDDAIIHDNDHDTYAITLYASWDMKSVTIRYYADETAQGSFETTSETYSGKIIDSPAKPQREGYTFDSWHAFMKGQGGNPDKTFADPWIFGAQGTNLTTSFGVSVSGDNYYLDLVPKFLPVDVTVSFELNEGTCVADGNAGTLACTKQTKKYGEYADAVSDPTRKGYTFSGWYNVAQSDDAVNPIQFVTGDSESALTYANGVAPVQGGATSTTLRLYAWYAPVDVKIVFNPLSGTCASANCGYKSEDESDIANKYDQKIARLNLLQNPVPPANKAFADWYLKDGSTSGDWGTLLNLADVTLNETGGVMLNGDAGTFTAYARYAPNKVNVVFDANGGVLAGSGTAQVAYGGKVDKPADPARDGYIFKGWNFGNAEWNFNSALTTDNGVVLNENTDNFDDFVLTAVWEQLPSVIYTVTFNTQGGSNVVAQIVTAGATASQPANPTRANYTFTGWFTSAKDGDKFDFATPITGNVTIFAQWTENTKPPAPPTPSPAPAPTNVKLQDTVKDNELKVTWQVPNVTNVQNFKVVLNNVLNSVKYESILFNDKKVTGEVLVSATARQALFTNVPTGSYTATVQSIGKNGVASSKSIGADSFAMKLTVGSKYKFVDTSKVENGRLNDINWLASVRVTVGSDCNASGAGSACKYNPNGAVNRGAMAQFLFKLAGQTETVNGVPKVTDISKLISSRQDAIKWLASEKITIPTAGKYKPSNTVNRGAMAEFMYKLAGHPGTVDFGSGENDHVDPKTVADVEKVLKNDKALAKFKKSNPNRYYDILWLAKMNITVPDSMGRYNPGNDVNRGAMAQFMHKLYWVMMTGNLVPQDGNVPNI
jgi:uncharacterized repeat protein (TIGR02543 family)